MRQVHHDPCPRSSGRSGIIGPARWGVAVARALLGDRSAMSRISRDRIRRLLDEAEGYLMLDLPRRSLQILGSRPDWFNHAIRGQPPQGRGLALPRPLSRGAQTAGNRRIPAARRQARGSGPGLVL